MRAHGGSGHGGVVMQRADASTPTPARFALALVPGRRHVLSRAVRVPRAVLLGRVVVFHDHPTRGWCC